MFKTPSKYTTKYLNNANVDIFADFLKWAISCVSIFTFFFIGLTLKANVKVILEVYIVSWIFFLKKRELRENMYSAKICMFKVALFTRGLYYGMNLIWSCRDLTT